MAASPEPGHAAKKEFSVATVITVLIILGMIIFIGAMAGSGSTAASTGVTRGRNLPRSNVQNVIDRIFYQEEVKFQTSAVILSNERHPEGRGELVLSTRMVHFVAYDETGHGVDGVLSFFLGDVLQIRRNSSNELILFVDDPATRAVVALNTGITTRFAFSVGDATSWLSCFASLYKTDRRYNYEDCTNQELMEQPVVDWAHRVELFAQSPAW